MSEKEMFYADGYFPTCERYERDDNLTQPDIGRTYAGYRHPSGHYYDHIYTSYLDNLSLEQAAKIYWRGRCIVRVEVPSVDPQIINGIPLHRLPSGARTRWGANAPRDRICGHWGWQLLTPAYAADPMIPSGTLGPPVGTPSDASEWTQFAARCNDVAVWIGVFHYLDHGTTKYGVWLTGEVRMQAVVWGWQFYSEDPFEGEWLPVGSPDVFMGFGPRGTEGGAPGDDITIATPWGDVTTTTSNNSLWPAGFHYNIVIEEDETIN